MSKTVSIDGLADAIQEELKTYSREVSAKVKKTVKDVAKECLEEIKNNSPEKTGSYKKGWRDSTVYDELDDTRIIVHNATDYQLTHLLEDGHNKKNLIGRVEGIPHIAPAERNASEKLEKRVVVKIQR